MHELGVVFKITKDLEEVAKENDIEIIDSVTIELGEVSTVIPDYLTDCWKWATKRTTMLATAPLIIEKIPAITYCRSCKGEYETVKYGKTCPYCKSDDTFLLQGSEFKIKEIEAV